MKRTIVLIVAVLATVLVTAPASAEVERDFEVHAYAELFGVDPGEAEVRLKRQRRLEKVLEKIEENEAARLAGIGYENGESFGAYVILVGDEEPTSATKRLLRRNRDIDLRLGAENTIGELVEAMDELADSGLLPASAQGIGVDQETNSLTLSLASDSTGINVAAARQAMLTEFRGIAVNVAYEGPQIEQTAGEILRGGRKLNLFGSDHCTGGFPVRVDGQPGILTAGHCLADHPVGLSYSTPGGFIEGVSGPTIDDRRTDAGVLIVGTIHKPRAKFYDGTRYRSIRKTNTANQGQMVCHFGWGSQQAGFGESGRSCGVVEQARYRPTGDYCAPQTCGNRFMSVTGPDLVVCNTDSGGPAWTRSHANYLAAGLVSGGNYMVDHDNNTNTPRVCEERPDGLMIISPLKFAVNKLEADYGIDIVVPCIPDPLPCL